MPFKMSRALPLVAVLLFAACAPPVEPAPEVQRLVDLFPEATVEGTPDEGEPGPAVRWDFTAPETAKKLELGAGLEAEIADGRLVGRTTSDMPLFELAREDELGDDLLHSVEIEARVSAGTELEVAFSAEKPDLQAPGILGGIFDDHRTPLLPGETLQTYVITPSVTVQAEKTRHVIVRPTDVEGAEVEIASVRLVFRKEHLGSIPAGIGWHGLDEVHRETIAARAPETVRYRLRLPERPRLGVALGTPDDRTVTFAVEITPSDEESATRILERAVEEPGTWHEEHIDLGAYAGREVELALRLEADEPGTLGFWGVPAVRQVEDGEEPPRKKVLLVVIDTLRTDHLNLYGYGRETAPALARFAAGGTSFRHALAQGTWTKVSMTSIFSGLYPPTHGVIEFQDRLPASATTVAEAFREAGYLTLSLSSIRFNGKFTNLHQGFETLHESGSLPDGLRSKTAEVYVDRLVPWLEAHRDVPFFATLHVADPHAPYRPPEPWDTHWATAEEAEYFEATVEEVVPAIEDPLMRNFKMPTRQELESVGADARRYVEQEHAWYDGSIRNMDDALARLFERLDELGLSDELVVAVVADHGTEFLDHDRHWHGHSVYGELARVPLLFRGQGVPAGEIRDEVVQTIDLAPTLLDLAGLAVPEGIQGRSLVPLFRGEAWRPRPAFVVKARQEGGVGPPPLETESFAIVTDGFKLVRHTGDEEGSVVELYDFVDDPLDTTDLSAEHPDVVERLSEQLDGWRRQAEAARLTDETDLESLSAEELERLRSLGYVN